MRSAMNSRTGDTCLLAIFLGGLLVLVALMGGEVRADNPGSRRPDMRDEICGVQVLHADGTYENGVVNLERWVQPPDFGSFAERYEGPAMVCAVTLDVSALPGYYQPTPFDVYVWSDDGGIPGVVLAMADYITMPLPFLWPAWSRWHLELPAPCPVDAHWWVGYWQQAQWQPFFLCADVDGPGGGRPMTKVRPGIEFPSGWQDIEVVFYPMAALGIGAEVLPAPTPVQESTWGRVKSLYRDATR